MDNNSNLNNTFNQPNKSTEQNNDSLAKNPLSAPKAARKYITLPGGKRKWIRV